MQLLGNADTDRRGKLRHKQGRYKLFIFFPHGGDYGVVSELWWEVVY